METEADFLKLLAERPFDRALRLVFSDWLQERGDPRGEFIALSHKEHPTASDQRRLHRLLNEGQGAWLGPLAEFADVAHCRWDGGFLSALAFMRGAIKPADIKTITGEPTLGTLRRLALPVDPPDDAWSGFLTHPVLCGLTGLLAPPAAWYLLARVPVPFTLTTAGIATWDVFDDELDVLDDVPAAQAATRLELSTLGMLNTLWTPDVTASVMRAFKRWELMGEVRLTNAFATVEGEALWLRAGATSPLLLRSWKKGRRWTIESADVVYTLRRESGGAFDTLTIDARGTRGPEDFSRRLNRGHLVLSQLKGTGLGHVEVLTAGAPVRPSERDTYRVAARRLRTVKTLHLGGEAVDP